MSSVAVYSSRSRASERQRNIRNDLNRASAYIMSNDYTKPYENQILEKSSYVNNNNSTYNKLTSTVTRRQRDSSLGALGRPNRDSSLTRTGAYTRDGSLPRYKESNVSLKAMAPNAPTSLITGIISNRHSIAVPVLDNGLGSETAKYNRQNDLKEIHNSFMKGFKDTNNKLNGDKAVIDDQGDRRSKAYSKIINDQPSYASEVDYQRHNYSEMFIETGKFSTRTLSAIKNLDGAVIRQKKRDPGDYQWRQDMEQYEKSSEYEKDKRIRNITTTDRNGKEDTVNKENHKNMSVQNKSRNALININGSDSSAKPPQSPKTKIKSKEVPKPVVTKESVNSATKITKPSKTVVEEVKVEPQQASRTSWRDRVAEKNKEETKKTDKVIEKVCEKNKEETNKSEKVIPQPKPTKPVPAKEKPVPAKEEAPANDPPTARKSWRDKVAEKEKEEEEITQKNVIKKQEPKEVLTEEEEEEKRYAQEMARSIRQKIEAQFPLEELPTEKTKAPASTSDGDKKPESNANDNKTEEGSQGEKAEAGQEEEEDTHGTKKMKSDFDAKMIALEEEMAAGRGKLAKLRERIRKAKGTVKAADNALDDAKKS